MSLRASLIVVLATIVALAAMANANIFDPTRRFTVTQRLRDPGVGQPFFNFSDSVHSLQRWVAVGSKSANAAKGHCRLYFDSGDGLKLKATVADSRGSLGDEFGHAVLLFERSGAMHVAVAAPGKSGDGGVLIFRRTDTDDDWPLQETLVPPVEADAYSTSFGRHILYDGVSIVVSAVSRYKNSKRFVISSTNVKGTRYFEENSGTEETSGDPVFTFRSRDGRGNSTRFTLLQTIRDADYTFNFGQSIALSTDRSRLAIGSVSRREARFGFGTDGDLLVEGVKLLDGTAEYNFNNIEIMPGGVLTTDVYESLRGAGGRLRLRVQGTLKIHEGGAINMSAHGFPGAPTMTTNSRQTDGEGPGGGITATSTFTGPLSCNHDGAGVAVLEGSQSTTTRNTTSNIAFAEANGGGGGYGTGGEAGIAAQCGTSGAGGPTYGDVEVATEVLGSGGGAGHPWKIGSGGAGGAGGGSVWVTARRIINDGVIACSGGRGSDGGFYSGGGGGGSGGSIYLSGTFFENNGKIYARGGPGGIRSESSGTSGDDTVRGGNGGVGRVRIEFLTTVTSGHVVPQPLNGTAFDGDIFLYTRSSITNLYTLYAKMPRLPSMRFVGHSVAMHGNMLAVGNDDRSFANPYQSVYLIKLDQIQNSSSPLNVYREVLRPNAADLQFGWKLALFNDTLVVGAAGQNDLVRGAVYVMSSRDLFDLTGKLVTLELPLSVQSVGDYYGQAWHYDYPQVVVSVPLGQDDGYTDPTARMSQGMVQVMKHVRNISSTLTTITCEYAAVTANTTVLCTINAVDEVGEPVGDVNDLDHFSYPPGLRYIQRGKYQFDVMARGSGPMEVWARHSGSKVQSASITVTPPVLALLSNVTCSPLNPVAGDTVTCTINTLNQAGEESAAKDFRVTVYHANDITLKPSHTDVLTSQGNFRSPPSNFVPADVVSTDFPSITPTVSFVRFGFYEFSYTTWRPGAHAAFIQYQKRALAFPNPVVIDAGEPVISATRSRINCPKIAAPNRTLVCTLFLVSAGDVPTDRAELAHNFSSVSGNRFIRARFPSSGNELTITAIWSQEGRISLLMYPAEEGTLVVEGEWHGTAFTSIPTTGVSVQDRFTLTCSRMSSIVMSFTVMNQHAMGRTDSSVYGVSAESVKYLEGQGMCDDGRL